MSSRGELGLVLALVLGAACMALVLALVPVLGASPT